MTISFDPSTPFLGGTKYDNMLAESESLLDSVLRSAEKKLTDSELKNLRAVKSTLQQYIGKKKVSTELFTAETIVKIVVGDVLEYANLYDKWWVSRNANPAILAIESFNIKEACKEMKKLVLNIEKARYDDGFMSKSLVILLKRARSANKVFDSVITNKQDAAYYVSGLSKIRRNKALDAYNDRLDNIL